MNNFCQRILSVTPCLFIEYGKYPHSDSIFHEAGGRVEYGIRMGIFPVFNKNKQGATILSYLVEKKTKHLHKILTILWHLWRQHQKLVQKGFPQ